MKEFLGPEQGFVDGGAVVVVQLEREMLQEGWRLRAQIDNHVKNAAALAPYQLAFIGWRPCEVQAAQRAREPVVRDAGLRDPDVDAMSRELFATPHTGKRAAFVFASISTSPSEPEDANRIGEVFSSSANAIARFPAV